MPKLTEKQINQHVGATIRGYRRAKERTQTWLADHAGLVTFQQIQKYENGKNRVSAGRLYLIATALNVPVQDFFPKE